MRRQDRRVTDIEEIKGILNSTRIIHLGLMDGDYPYVVPLHFGYEFIDEVLYIKRIHMYLLKLMVAMKPSFQVEIYLVNIARFTLV